MAKSSATEMLTAALVEKFSGWVVKNIKRLVLTALWMAAGYVLACIVFAYLGISLSPMAWLWFLVALWLSRRAYIVNRYIHGHRLLLAGDSLRYPGHRATFAFWWAERSHRAQLVKQFAIACESYGLRNPLKQSPTLSGLTTMSDGSMTATIAPGPMGIKGGVREFQILADDIAITCGCAGGIDVRPFGAGPENQPGHARLTFRWEKKVWPLLPIQKLATPKPGRLVLGNDADLNPVSIPLGFSTLIVGMTGMGKSSALWTMLTSIAMSTPSLLYVIDPKGGQELGGWLGYLHTTINNRTVAGYVNSGEEKAYALIGEVEAKMKERQKVFGISDDDTPETVRARVENGQGTTRKWTQGAAKEFPLITLVIDEAFEMMEKMTTPAGKKARVQLETILSQGRACGFQVIMLSQIPNKDVLGASRSLIKVRIVMGTETATDTGMAFGKASAETDGARCSEITEPGFAYVKQENVPGEPIIRGYRLVRIAYVDDEDVTDILRTGLPSDMGDDGKTKVERWKPHWNYRYFSAGHATINGVPVVPGQLVYVGETNVVKRRHEEHVRDFQTGKRDQWMQYVDPTARPLITYAPNETAALRVQTYEIENYCPIGNIMENKKNPWFGQPPVAAHLREPSRLSRVIHKTPKAAVLVDQPKPVPTERPEFVRPDPAPVAEPPANVTPIRRTRTRPDTTTTVTRTRTRRSA